MQEKKYVLCLLIDSRKLSTVSSFIDIVCQCHVVILYMYFFLLLCSLFAWPRLFFWLDRYTTAIDSMSQGYTADGGWFSVNTDCTSGVVSGVT